MVAGKTEASANAHSSECPSVVELKPGNYQSVSSFLKWWMLHFNGTTPRRFLVDLTDLDSSIRNAASEIVRASGHSVVGEVTVQFRPDLSLISNVVLSESVFADIEERPEKLDLFLNYYRLTLRSIANQEPVQGTRFVHFTHISRDKVNTVISLAKEINRLNATSKFATLYLNVFEHPEEGYLKPNNGHIDQVMRPSLFNGRPEFLFDRAFLSLAEPELKNKGFFIRVCIDDDDLWMPYAIEEMVKQGKALLDMPGRDNRCVGISNQFLYYPLDGGRLDSVDMRMVMPGSKFNVAEKWTAILSRHPWMLPESFSSNVARQMRARKVDISVARNARPILIYVRRHGRLSAMTKFEHYRNEPRVLKAVGSDYDALESAIELSRSFEVESTPEFSVDPPTPEARAELISPSCLQVRLNSDELTAAFGLQPSALEVCVKCATNDGTDINVFPFQPSFEVNPSLWTGRAILTICDAEGKELFGTWIRGNESYLS